MEHNDTLYQETLNYLFGQLPMYQRVGPKAFKKDLDNIIGLCKVLNEPQHSFPSIHIAGTNGKGSTAHLLAAILQAHGLKTGLYTSPHYRDYRERIKINGRLISKKAVIEFVEKIKTVDHIQPSFFEISVAMAFYYFQQQEVDIAVIETGLGGRLDSTNVLDPLMSVITNIGFDHMNFLGDTLPLIAGEKAGIIKYKRPVVVGEPHPQTTPVFKRKALQCLAPLYFAPHKYRCIPQESSLFYSVFNVFKEDVLLYNQLKVNITGSYQQHNLRTALQSIDILSNEVGFFELLEAPLRFGLENLRSLTQFIGRWQVIKEHPFVICDSAHNKEGILEAMKNIDAMEFDNLHMVIGMVKDKDPLQLLKLLPENAQYYFAKPNVPRGLDAKLLQEFSKSAGLKGRTYKSVAHALAAAERNAESHDLIFVGGSTFVVAEIV